MMELWCLSADGFTVKSETSGSPDYGVACSFDTASSCGYVDQSPGSAHWAIRSMGDTIECMFNILFEIAVVATAYSSTAAHESHNYM